MPAKLVQRTLIIGLGQIGALTGSRLQTKLAGLLGEACPISAFTILSDDSNPEQFTQPILVIPDAEFEVWLPELGARVEQTLIEISQVSALSRLAQSGFKLENPGEIHVLLLIDLAETDLTPEIDRIINLVREYAYRRLSCRISVTGIMLDLSAVADEPSHTSSPNGAFEADMETLLKNNIFDHGCFIAGTTNEVGLIVGDKEVITEQVAAFLTLLLTDVSLTRHWNGHITAGWGTTLTSFGLARLGWPAEALIETLSKRWSQACLNEQIMLSGPEDPAGSTRTAVQQWLTTQKLSPLLLLGRLETQMPSAPNYLAELAPDTPWPWLLTETSANLNDAARRWQERWLAQQQKIRAELAELSGLCPAEVQTWLHRELGRYRSGGIIWVQSYLAAMSEMLRAITEGVEQKLDEAQTDLAHLEQQVKRAEEALADELKDFPTTIPFTALRWGLLPLRWPRYTLRCRQGKKLARNLAHLLRGRLLTWQTCSFYEELLPFYHRLLADWEKIVTHWAAGCEQVRQAGQSAELIDWAEALDQILTTATGPWRASLVAERYHQAVGQFADQVSAEVGAPADWIAAGQSAGQITDSLRQATAQALVPLFKVPVDEILAAQFPPDGDEPDWLTGLWERAIPFWPYDETELAENARSRMRLERWLFLPGGAESPLAGLFDRRNQTLSLLSGQNPSQMTAVILRHITRNPLKPIETEDIPLMFVDDDWLI